MHPFLDFVCDHLVSQNVNDNCMYQIFPCSALLKEETLLELLTNVTYLKKNSMNSYFFFRFHIFKYCTVTFTCHKRPKTSLN